MIFVYLMQACVVRGCKAVYFSLFHGFIRVYMLLCHDY